MNRILVTGAGGFIGGHLVERLVYQYPDVKIRAVDIKPIRDWYQVSDSPNVANWSADLKNASNCLAAVTGCDEVYNLAADMGGMGFIETHKADCMMSVLINTHLLKASVDRGVKRFFYASSACVYAADKQTDPDVTALKESDAYPAMPEDGYGWEKLFSERMCRHFTEDYGLVTRVARFHNVYGPHGTYEGGREKAPAAICRKVLEAKRSGDHTIEIWGDGEQTRSFMYVTDCVDGILRIMHSAVEEPINLGSAELVSINELVSLVEAEAGLTLNRTYDLSAPQGVRGRNSDNTLILKRLGWEPHVSLEYGMRETYWWIADKMSCPKSGGEH